MGKLHRLWAEILYEWFMGKAALKLIYLALQNISRKWTMPVKDWRAALNQFAILFEGRLPLV